MVIFWCGHVSSNPLKTQGMKSSGDPPDSVKNPILNYQLRRENGPEKWKCECLDISGWNMFMENERLFSKKTLLCGTFWEMKMASIKMLALETAKTIQQCNN